MDFLWAHICAPLSGGQLPLVAVLLLAGLGGSVSHCATMCSTFVLSQTASLTAPNLFSRLLLPYHLGRMLTYAALGGVAGLSFHLIARWQGFDIVRHLMLALAAVAFLAVCVQRLLAKAGVVLPQLPFARPACAVAGMSRAGRARDAVSRFGLGLALGLLPCPLVYAALLAVAAHADPVLGAVAMAAFALGTSPLLMGIGVAGHHLIHGHPRLRDGLSLTALGINGLVLLALAAG